MKVLHVVPGLDVVGNGIAVAAKLIAAEQGADLAEARLFARGEGELDGYDEVWVHSCWLPMTLKSCCRVLRAGKPLVRMTHANLDPVRLKFHGWKKWFVGPIERWCLRRCDRIVATCEAEKGWIERYLGKKCPPVEVTDIKRFFKLTDCKIDRLIDHRIDRSGDYGADDFKQSVNPTIRQSVNSSLHLLYLGRRHPLKGIECLEAAVSDLNSNPVSPVNPVQKTSARPELEFRIVSSAFGEELEKVWQWCDVLVLPTLSENFGLVVAEALERGKRVITTDGAPAWGDGLTGLTGFTGLYSGYEGRLIYLKGYRGGTPEERVRLLKYAIEKLCQS